MNDQPKKRRPRAQPSWDRIKNLPFKVIGELKPTKALGRALADHAEAYIRMEDAKLEAERLRENSDQKP